MSHDESPANAAAESANAPEDAAPRADAPAAPIAPARRRSSTPRPRKTAAPAESRPTDAKPVEATPLPPDATDLAPASAAQEPAPTPRSSRRRTTRKPKSTPSEVEAPVTEAIVEPPPASPTALPFEAEAPVEPGLPPVIEIGTAPALAPSSASEQAVAPKPRPARRRPARKPKETTPAPVEMEAPAAEAPPTPEPAMAAVVTGETLEEPATAVEMEAPTEETSASVTEASPETKPTRRRTTRRKAAEAAETVPQGARLVIRRGMVELHINGTPYPPVFFFGNVEGQKEARRVVSEVQRAARAGVHLHSTLIELPCPLPADDSVYAALDERLNTLLEADLQGFVMPRIVFLPAPGWRKQYPNEVNQYADGTTDDPSFASERYWQEAEQALTAVIEHIGRSQYSERVIGYHLERGEWFHPSDSGYDRSFANREAFRAWLRAKYKSEAALRAAWYDGQVQFYTADIPPLPAAPRPEVAFFEPRRERRWIDFLEYTSEVTADRLITLSRVVKQASGGRALVSVCYGYTFEFGHTHSGHLALGRLLAAPSVDIISGPPSYRDRQPGCAASLPSPVHAMNVHGKLWLSEDDTKTYLAPAADTPDDFNPRLESRGATEQAQLRAMGRAMAYQSGMAWMDLWGEGWLDSPEVWDRIGAFTQRYHTFIGQRRAWSPEVAVIVSERSLLHLQRGEAFLRRLLSDPRELLERSGASVGFYLQSDIIARNFPTDAKLYLFLNPYRLPADQRAAIKEKLMRRGKTLAWMYAAAVCDERGQPEESAHELIGIALRQQSWNSEVGSRVTETRHPITEGFQNKTFGVRERLNPSYYVDDDTPGVRILAEYQQTGLPSLAVREFDGWRSVFCGEPALNADLLQGLCRYAGVHLFTRSMEDYVFAGDGWVTLHSLRDGNRTLHLPRPAALYDLIEGRLLGEDLREHRLATRARTTRSFYFGTVEEMIKLGLPGIERQRGRRRRSGPVVVIPSVQEPPVEIHTPQEEAVGSEDVVIVGVDEAIQEYEEARAESIAESPVPGSTAETENEAAERKRRRRRRGGRGRGRRSRVAGETSGSPPTESE